MAPTTIYGPVRSWRFGQSLGVDLILDNSVCSFDCVYCQLGPIQVRTLERREFVKTERVLADLAEHEWRGADVVTFSGSGEPTLAANLGEALVGVASLTELPTIVLTNGTLLNDDEVGAALCEADRVEVKLDAADEEIYRRVNRPVGDVSLAEIVDATIAFRARYSGHLSLQIMMLPMNRGHLDGVTEHVRRIAPDSVCVNSPGRPRPRDWYLPSRGSHGEVPYPARPLRRPSASDCERLAQHIADETGVDVCVDAGERTLIGARSSAASRQA